MGLSLILPPLQYITLEASEIIEIYNSDEPSNLTWLDSSQFDYRGAIRIFR